MIEPTALDVIGHGIVELACPRQRFLVVGRQRLAGIKIAHRRRQPGPRQGVRIAAHEGIDAENRRHDQHTAFTRRLRRRQIAVKTVAGYILRLDRHCFALALSYSAATRLPIAALTAGMTFSAISSIEWRDRTPVGPVLAAIQQRAEVADRLVQRQNPIDDPFTVPRMTTFRTYNRASPLVRHIRRALNDARLT